MTSHVTCDVGQVRSRVALAVAFDWLTSYERWTMIDGRMHKHDERLCCRSPGFYTELQVNTSRYRAAIPETTHSCCWHTWSTSTPLCQHQSPGRIPHFKLSTTASRAFPRLLPYRSGTHYQKQSFRHQHCGRSCTNWKRSYLNYHCISGLAVTFVTLVTLILFWLIDWLIPRLYIPATVWEHLLGRDIVDNDDRTITLWYGCTMNIF